MPLSVSIKLKWIRFCLQIKFVIQWFPVYVMSWHWNAGQIKGKCAKRTKQATSQAQILFELIFLCIHFLPIILFGLTDRKTNNGYFINFKMKWKTNTNKKYLWLKLRALGSLPIDWFVKTQSDAIIMTWWTENTFLVNTKTNMGNEREQEFTGGRCWIVIEGRNLAHDLWLCVFDYNLYEKIMTETTAVGRDCRIDGDRWREETDAVLPALMREVLTALFCR